MSDNFDKFESSINKTEFEEIEQKKKDYESILSNATTENQRKEVQERINNAANRLTKILKSKK